MGRPAWMQTSDLYFSTLHVEFMCLETKFINFAQAIEGYHRCRLNRTTYDDVTFRRVQGDDPRTALRED